MKDKKTLSISADNQRAIQVGYWGAVIVGLRDELDLSSQVAQLAHGSALTRQAYLAACADAFVAVQDAVRAIIPAELLPEVRAALAKDAARRGWPEGK